MREGGGVEEGGVVGPVVPFEGGGEGGRGGGSEGEEEGGDDAFEEAA